MANKRNANEIIKGLFMYNHKQTINVRYILKHKFRLII